jgi:hypothetical protein
MTEKKIGLTEGILIASIPVIGYWCAFLYELGYNTYFGIPSFFVEVGLVPTMVAILSLCSFFAFIYMYAEVIFMTVFRGLPAPLKSSFLVICLVCSIVVGFAIIGRLTFSEFVTSSIPIIAVICFLEFFFPLITQRKTKGYLAKLEAQNTTELSVNSLLNVVARKIGRNFFAGLYFFYLFSLLAYFAGGFNAKFQREFMVLSGTPELVVLKKYDSNFVAANFDRLSKTVSTEYVLLPVDKSLGQFKIERIGPLSPMSPK